MTKRRQISLLPAIHQTEPLKRFFSSTVDPLFEEGKTQPVAGYIGRKPAHFDAAKDFYKPEPTPAREHYQLEPMMVSADPETRTVQSQLFYEDLLSRLSREGAFTNEPNRLFSAGYYSWAPPIDIDRIVNFNQYYWNGSKVAPLVLTVPGVEVGARYYADGFSEEYDLPPKLASRADDEEEIVVLINGVVVTTSWTLNPSGTKVVFSAPPTLDAIVTLFRYGNVTDGTRQVFAVPAHCPASLFFPDDCYVFVNGRETTDFSISGTEDEDGRGLSVTLDSPPPANSHVMVSRIKDLKGRIEGQVNFAPAGLTLKNIPALLNGMKVKLVDPVNFTKGYDLKAYEHLWDEIGHSEYYVEGVDVAIELIPVGEGDGYVNDDPQYTVMSRADKARGYWSRVNRWVHKDALIEATDATFGNRAKRPIIEFLAGVRQYGHGTHRTVNATCAMTDLPRQGLLAVGFEDINGLPEGSLTCDDGHVIRRDDIILVDLEGSSANSQLWRVATVADAEDSQPLYVLEPMGQLTEGTVTSVRTVEYFFDGTGWNVITNPIEAPLFNLYDKDGIALDDVGVYPDSTFAGSRLFSFAPGAGRVDKEIRKRLSYDKYGQIMFENDLETTRYDYNVGEIEGYYYYKRGETYFNGWHLADQNLITAINEYNVSDIPLNLQANPDFDTPTFLSRNDFFPHFESIIAGQDGFTGQPYGYSNWNSTPKDPAKGVVIVQHEAPLLKLMALTERDEFSVPDAIRFVEREYTRFRLKFLKQVRELSYQQDNDAFDPKVLAMSVMRQVSAGKTSSFPFHDTLVGGAQYFIPLTPALIGITPLVKPEWIIDDSSGVEVEVLRGHDGTMTSKFGDSRDAALLAFEQLIYDNADIVKEKMPLHTMLGGRTRTSLYTPHEFNTIMLPAFEQWTRDNNASLDNTQFVEGDPFTYNYRSATDRFGHAVPGHWRAIYRLYFDTERPHLSPWEMLGFAERPYWWVGRYGNAPYTRGNTILWNDIAAGIIREGARAGTYPELARPDLMQVLPVDLTGKLLDPIAATIIPTAPPVVFASRNWQFGDGAEVEAAWRASPHYPFALALAKYLMRPAFFVEGFWDVLNEEIVHDTQTVQLPEYRRVHHAEMFINGEITTTGEVRRSLGVQNWIVDHLLQSGKTSETLGRVIRGLSTRLGHKVAGFTTKDRMTISAESFGLVPDEDITISLYESPSLNEFFYSGMIIENTMMGYRVIGYNPRYPFFDIVLPEENSRREIISPVANRNREPIINQWTPSVYYKKNVLVEYDNAVWRCNGAHTSGSKFEETFWVISPITQKQQSTTVYRHTKATDMVSRVEYGTEFRTKQEVADLIFAYERWLVLQGFVFSDEADSSASWTMAVKNFLKWSDVNWAEGTFMTISPAARQLKFVTARGLVNEIEHAIIDRTGHVFKRENFSVDRDETETVITAHVDDIYGARLTVTEIEHCLIFSNETIFDDSIYDPLFNVRQDRLKLSARVAPNWTGRYEAPGFVLRGNEIVPNFHKAAEDLREMFDIELADNTALRDHARHVIGFESRPYLDQLLLSETQQFELYQGMIQQKGALGAMSAILRSDEIAQSRNLRFLEEWAFRIGSFGAFHPTFEMEFLISQLDIHNEKQVIHLLENGNADWVNLTASKWVSTPENFASLLVAETAETMPDAGYIRAGEANHVYRDLDVFSDAVTDALVFINEGEVLWLTHGRDWDAVRLSYPSADLSEITVRRIDNETSGAIDNVEDWRIVFSANHNLVIGDKLILSGGYYEHFRGIHTVVRVGLDWVEVTDDLIFPFDFEDTLVNGMDSPPPIALRTTPLRVATHDAMTALAFAYPSNTYCYVDNVNGGWAVYRKINTSWVLQRSQPKKIENTKIKNALIYAPHSVVGETELLVEPAVADEMVVIDPLSGLIPGIVDRELDYKIEIDPADYSVWGLDEVGLLWWDLSTVRYVNYYTDVMESLDPTSVRYVEELEYRTANWGKVTETSSVDIYEWTRSLARPADGIEFIEHVEYDAALNKTVTAYYCWTLNPTVVPLRPGRRLSAKSCSEIIQNPAKAGLVWYAAMAKTAILMTGTRGLFADEPRIFQLEYNITDYQGDEHSEWLLMRPGDTETPPDAMLWNKLLDSLRGFDLNLRALPDANLHPTQKGGLGELQSVFGEISIKDARRSFIEMMNYILARNNYSKVGSLEENLSLSDDPSEYLYWSAHSADDLAILPPRIEYDYMVYDPSDIPTALQTYKRVLLNNMAGEVPSWSVWEKDEDGAPRIMKMYDREYATRAEMIEDMENVDYFERILVRNDEEADGFWTVWLKRGEWDLKPFASYSYDDGYVLGMVNAQKYRTNDFWYYADWFDASVDPALPPQVVYQTIGERNSTEGTNPDNLFVKVLDDGNYWSWYQWTGTEWFLVAREHATIQLLTAFYKRDTVYGVKDGELFFDTTGIASRDGTLDLSVLVNALATVLLTTEEENELWFSMIHFIHSKLDKVDWAFKTSFLNVLGYNQRLWASPIAVKDNLALLLQYIDEVKPYRVKIREVLLSAAPDIDTATLGVTDFDRPPYFDDSTDQYRQLVDGADGAILSEGIYKAGFENPDQRRRMKIGMLFDRIWPSVGQTQQGAAERIMAFYQPGTNMRAKNLTDLLKLDFKGTVYDGSLLGNDNDVTLRGSNADGSQVALNVGSEGFKLRDPARAPNLPEELASVGFHDGLLFRAHDRWADGAPLNTARHFNVSRRTGATATLDIGTLADSVVVFRDGVRADPSEYTLDQLAHTVTVNLTVTVSGLTTRVSDITIHAFGFASHYGRIADQVYLKGGEDSYHVPELFNALSAEIWINGELAPSDDHLIDGLDLTVLTDTTTNDALAVTLYTAAVPEPIRQVVETIAYNSDQTWQLQHLPMRAPFHVGTFIEVNGLRLTPPKTYYVDGDTELYLSGITIDPVTKLPTNLSSMRVYDDANQNSTITNIEDVTSQQYTSIEDAIAATKTAGLRYAYWDRWVLFVDEDAETRSYTIVLNDSTSDFTLSDFGELHITKTLAADDVIRATTFANDEKMAMRTHVFAGNPEGIYPLQTRRRGSAWFTLNGKRLTENVEFAIDDREMGTWDLDPFEIFNYDELRWVNFTIRQPGEQPVSDIVITTFEGTEAQPEKDWQLATQAPEEMRLLLNSSNQTLYIPRKAYELASLDPIRRSGALVADIDAEANTIQLRINPFNVPTKMIPSQPLQVPTKEVPGVVWIDAERIEYFGYKRTGSVITISELRRGTRGTAMTRHLTGALGYALHPLNKLPPEGGPDIDVGPPPPPPPVSGILGANILITSSVSGSTTTPEELLYDTVYTVPDRNDFPFSLEFDLPDPWPSGYPAGVSGPIIGYLPQVSWRTTNFDFTIYDEHSNNYVSSYGNNGFLYFASEACRFSPNSASNYWSPDGKVVKSFTLTHPDIPTLSGTITATFEYITTSAPPKMKLTFSCDRPALFTPGALGYIEISVSSMPEWDFDTYHPVVIDGNGAVLSAISEIFTSSTENGGDLKYSRFRVELPAFPKGAALRYAPDKVGLTGAANFNLGSRSSVDVVDVRSATQTGFIDFVAGTANFGNGLITDLSTCIGGPDFVSGSLTSSGLVLTSPTNVPRAIGPLLEQLQVETQTMVWEWQQDSLTGSPTIFRASNADESGGVDSYIFEGHFYVSEWYGDFNSIGGSFVTGPMKAAITVDDFGWTGAINGSPAIYSMPNTKYTLTNWMIGNVILSGYDPLGGTLKKITFYTPGNTTDTQNLSSQ